MNPNSMVSRAWILFCYVSFATAIGITGIGIWALEVSLTMKAFLVMGILFITSSAFNLAKVLRDEHEAARLHHQIDEAKTEWILREVEAV